MIETLTWWLALTVIGALLLPLCLIALRRLPDRGYALSKPFGLLFVGYVFWLGNSAGLLPNSATGIVLAAIPLILVAAWFAQREREDLREWLHDHWRYIAVVEGLFFLVFVTAVWLRSTVGEITGTEQPMDLMFLNAATQADSFPPKDSWLSGETVAYYWFGYLLVAVMGKLSSVPTDAAYNIGLGMIAAMALTGAAGIVYGLVSMREKAMIGPGQPERGQAEDARARPQKPPKQPRRRQAEPTPSERGSVPGGAGLGFGGLAWKPLLFGLAGGLMLVVMGNLVYVLVFASAYGFGSEGFFEWVNIDGLTADEPRYGQWYPAEYFQFFGATRIIPLDDEGFRAITEFPMFSYLLGDLHPHVMALPFVLLVVGLALSLFRSAEPLDVTFWLQRPLLLLAAAVMLGALTFINTWDVATFGFLIVAAAFVSNFTRVRSVTADLFVQTLSFALPLLLLAFLFYVPFVVSISGNSQVNGISAVVTNSTLTHSATRPLHAFLFWGPLFVLVFPFVVARVLPERRRITFGMLLTSGAPAVIVVLGWIIVFFAQSSGAFEGLFPEENLRQGAGSIAGQVGDRGWGWLTYLGLSTFLGAAMLALCLELTAGADRGERLPAMFALTLTVVALLLVLGCEFFFVGDVFTSRMNTVFKLYYQAWLLLAVAAGYSLYYLSADWRVGFPEERPLRYAWAAGAALVLAGAALYPLGGSLNRARPYNDGGLIVVTGSLHGLSTRHPDEIAAWDWLWDRAKGQDDVIAETVGNDYTEAGRVSMATGMPTVLGWLGHENQWRNGDCPPCAGRFEDMELLYSSGQLAEAQQVIDKYGIRYIYVGVLERNKYGGQSLAKFEALPVAFQQGAVTIYRAGG